MVSVHPARRCTSPLRVVPVGLGDGVGHCHDVANLLGKCLSISLQSFFGGELYSFFQGMVLFSYALLSMLEAHWEPTPCYRDAYSVGTPNWASWEKGWLTHCKTTFSPPFLDVSFWSAKRTLFFWRAYSMDVPNWKGKASWAWPSVFYPWSAVH